MPSVLESLIITLAFHGPVLGSYLQQWQWEWLLWQVYCVPLELLAHCLHEVLGDLGSVAGEFSLRVAPSPCSPAAHLLNKHTDTQTIP